MYIFFVLAVKVSVVKSVKGYLVILRKRRQKTGSVRPENFEGTEETWFMVMTLSIRAGRRPKSEPP